ncbi:MAG: hypothetical protein AAF202_04205 [Pseudomonadota bacterium]
MIYLKMRQGVSDRFSMGIYLLSFVSVVLFCLSARCFVNSLMSSPFEFRSEDYSVKALRVERVYKTFAWGVLTLFLFYSFLLSFWQSFSEVVL